MRVKKFCVVK